MIVGITYTDDRMTKSAELCKSSMLKNGFDEAWIWTRQSGKFNYEFVEFNYKTINAERGAGYWLWKPYIINKQLSAMQDGEFLVYSDAGVEWVGSPQHIIDVMDQDIFLFSNGHQHVHWCKMDVLEAILCEEHQVLCTKGQEQAQASVIFIRVNEFTRKFVKEWLLWCQMPGFIDDSPSVLPNHPEFAEHRHDQAILTCMAIKYGIKLHYWPDSMWYWSQRHRWPDDTYPLIFSHHRKRDNEWHNL